MGGSEVSSAAREACVHVARGQAQHGGGRVLAVQHPAPALACINVCQEGGNGREVRGEIIIHILGLPGEVLSGDNAVGAHLAEERDKR